ncbi:hypothetical protein ACFOWE_32105 [Planomonospora corallina]|uniref:Uncharacterized protein n=1 Tax=Planomonospora corallina TaxID=1806052 RepID=A0ABV8IIY1_9ACTN
MARPGAAGLLAVDPADCVVVEDAPHGVNARKAAGCTVVGVATTHAPDDLGGADVCFTSLAEAAPYLLAVIDGR